MCKHSGCGSWQVLLTQKRTYSKEPQAHYQLAMLCWLANWAGLILWAKAHLEGITDFPNKKKL